MAAKGPTPKRSEERHGHRAKAELAAVDTSAKGSTPVEWPEPEQHWHPAVTRWFRSLQTSGQAVWFEPSDVAAAVYAAEGMNQNLSGEKFSAMLFTAVWTAMGDLLTTEASRRRLRIELEKAQAEPDPEYLAAVESISSRRRPSG